jgi:poly(3-hydroxybutyrate) depolymerase
VLACYPDVFAAGAVVAGLPYGTATNVQQALEAMFQCPTRPPEAWGDAVRRANPGYQGSWPRVSVWHGSADRTVVPSNAQEIIKQWTSVHRLEPTPNVEDTIDGYSRQLWLDASGKEIIESYVIADMAHGTPLSTGDADFQCGTTGPFLLEAGISSSFHIARFFGLTEAGAKPAKSKSITVRTTNVTKPSTRSAPNGEAPPAWGGTRNTGRIDIGAVIAKALTAAGLMKE